VAIGTKAAFMGSHSWFVRLEQTQTSYLLLATLAGMGLFAGLLFRIGIAGWALSRFASVVKGSIQGGFWLWERSFAWATWQEFLIVVAALELLGGGESCQGGVWGRA